MTCLRGLEDNRASLVAKCCRLYPKLRDWIPVGYIQADIGRYIEPVRSHVTTLAREQIQQDIQSLNNNQGIDEEDKSREKENILKKLKKLSPGESSTINAMVNDTGRICTTPEDIAEILKKH